MDLRANHVFATIFCLAVCVLSVVAMINYPGRITVYIIFTILLQVLFVLGFTKDRIFFDTFIGIFFWLGYWLKFSVRVAFFGGRFHEPVGNFDGSGISYDHALFVTSCGVAALIMANFIRRRFLFTYRCSISEPRHESIFRFYKQHRQMVLIFFCSLFIFVAVTNVIFGIYQRGSVPRTIMPFGLNGVYTWFLLFGLASISAVILDCEFRINHNPYLVSAIVFVECFFSSTSMLSRGMIINGAAFLIGITEKIRNRLFNSRQYVLVLIAVFAILFAISMLSVSHTRRYIFRDPTPERIEVSSFLTSKRVDSPLGNTIYAGKQTILDRWVGMEGILAVSSYPGLGWDLWKKAWLERYSDSGTSMYDVTIIDTAYKDVEDISKHHFISLPGILAFFYYPGSSAFLFLSMFCLGLIAAVIEVFVYRCGGRNIILCALLGEVIAYRYAHFGYVPNRSYLLFGSIVLNVLIIFVLERFLSWYGMNRSGHNGAESSEI